MWLRGGWVSAKYRLVVSSAVTGARLNSSLYRRYLTERTKTDFHYWLSEYYWENPASFSAISYGEALIIIQQDAEKKVKQ